MLDFSLPFFYVGCEVHERHAFCLRSHIVMLVLLLSGDFTGYIRLLSPLILHTYIYIHIRTRVHTVCPSGIMTENIVAPVAVILLGVMNSRLA